jgi:hypothetical protein
MVIPVWDLTLGGLVACLDEMLRRIGWAPVFKDSHHPGCPSSSTIRPLDETISPGRSHDSHGRTLIAVRLRLLKQRGQ